MKVGDRVREERMMNEGRVREREREEESDCETGKEREC